MLLLLLLSSVNSLPLSSVVADADADVDADVGGISSSCRCQ